MATDYSQWLPALVALVAAPLAAVVTWQLTRSKRTADVESTYATAANMSVETMLQVVEQLRFEVAELRVENAALHSEVQRLSILIHQLGGTK